MDKKITRTALLISTLVLSSCSSSGYNKAKTNVASQPKLTVAEVMKRQSGGNDVSHYRKSLAQDRSQSYARTRSSNVPSHANTLANYTRSEAKELRGMFPRLPNPDLCMYVYPHLSLEEATIPGYSSCFSMYDRNHYALPGEMPATLQSTN